MALARALGVALTGVAASLVEIEADLSAGLPGLTFTGLADTAVREARDRIRSAIGNCGGEWPNRRITVALLPADAPKAGSRFDLAMAVAVLGAAGQVPAEPLARTAWIAELGLDGRLRPVRGVLPSAVIAQRSGIERIIVSPGNAAEAALVGGVDVRVADDLREVIGWLRGEASLDVAEVGAARASDRHPPDLADVAGQTTAKRGLELAAAGGHHAYLVGPPGVGKTLLAERLPGLLPELGEDAALEVSAVHSVAGLLGAHAGLITRPPLQAPHHTASTVALVGGGAHLARPGAISLAHHGVLFLDEAPEFSPATLQALRQPLEHGYVVLHRSGGNITYPARFQLVLAANPCPCGNRGAECTCAPMARRRYQQRLSGPLLDRIDIRVQVEAVPHVELFADEPAETTAAVAARVAQARAAAGERWRGCHWRVNAQAPGRELRKPKWRLGPAAMRPVETHLRRGRLSARGLDRVLRLSWTLADLRGITVPGADEVAEALFFRTGEGAAWAA
jgi:magnesium chelatase family protein